MKLLWTRKNKNNFFKKAVAERSKATDCKSVKFYFTLVRIQPALNMRNYNWTCEIIFTISLLLFGLYLFVFPKTIVQFFIDQNNRSFFVSDVNLFTYMYVSTLFFFRYIVYAPFFYCRCFLALNKVVSHDIYRIRIYIVLTLRYFHAIAFLCNHFDFSNSYADQFNMFFESQINNIELTYVLKQYSGSFWDFMFSLTCYQFIMIYSIENPTITSYINYNMDYKSTQFIINTTKNFWLSFNIIWCLRLTILCFISYFFCGEGRAVDFIVLVITIICIEILLFTFRLFFLLKTYNCVLIYI